MDFPIYHPCHDKANIHVKIALSIDFIIYLETLKTPLTELTKLSVNLDGAHHYFTF
jgi:hypothetical protein